MTAQTRDDNPAAAFAGISLDLKPLTAAAPAAVQMPAAAPAAAAAAPRVQQAQRDLRLGELLSLTESLTEAMEAETDALRSMDMARFGELSERKVGLANHYATLLWHMRKSPDSLRRLDPQDRAVLRAATERMQTAGHDNEVAVRGAHQASQILMNAIAKAAQASRPSATTYGANGRAGAGAGYGQTAGPRGSAIFQDTRL